MLSCITVPVMGVLSAIAIPNFIAFQARAKQMECKGNLRALHSAQRDFYAREHRYTEDLGELGFSFQDRRYAYFYSSDGKALQPTLGPEVLALPLDLPRGVQAECPECEFTAICAGTLWSDAPLDIWMISTSDQKTTDDEPLPAGQVFPVQNALARDT